MTSKYRRYTTGLVVCLISLSMLTFSHAYALIDDSAVITPDKLIQGAVTDHLTGQNPLGIKQTVTDDFQNFRDNELKIVTQCQNKINSALSLDRQTVIAKCDNELKTYNDKYLLVHDYAPSTSVMKWDSFDSKTTDESHVNSTSKYIAALDTIAHPKGVNVGDGKSIPTMPIGIIQGQQITQKQQEQLQSKIQSLEDQNKNLIQKYDAASVNPQFYTATQTVNSTHYQIHYTQEEIQKQNDIDQKIASYEQYIASLKDKYNPTSSSALYGFAHHGLGGKLDNAANISISESVQLSESSSIK